MRFGALAKDMHKKRSDEVSSFTPKIKIKSKGFSTKVPMNVFGQEYVK